MPKLMPMPQPKPKPTLTHRIIPYSIMPYHTLSYPVQCYDMLCYAIRSDPKPTLSCPILQVQVRSDQMAAQDELSSPYHIVQYHIMPFQVVSHPSYPALLGNPKF